MPKQTFLDKVTLSFGKTARTQEIKGVIKYGHELQPMDHKWDWLEMAKQELVDGFKYLEAEEERRNKLIEIIRASIIQASQCVSHDRACHYLTIAMGELEKLRGGRNRNENSDKAPI